MSRAQNDNPAFAIFVVIVLVAVRRRRRQPAPIGIGRRFLSVRANERAAAAAGINVARTKLLAFGIERGDRRRRWRDARLQAGRRVVGQLRRTSASLVVLAFAYLGGITSINGAIVGGLLRRRGRSSR